MNHKRKRPKHQRAGCIFCKPHKDERAAKILPANDNRKLVAPVLDEAEVIHPAEMDLIGCECSECTAAARRQVEEHRRFVATLDADPRNPLTFRMRIARSL